MKLKITTNLIKFLLLGCLCLIMSGCASSTRTVIFDDLFFSLAGVTADEFANDVSNARVYRMESARKNEDGSVTVMGTIRQCDALVQRDAQKLQDYRETFATIADGYKIDISSDYRRIDFYLTPELADWNFMLYFIPVAQYAAYCQLYSGGAPDGRWNIQFSICNSATGKLVNSFTYSEFHAQGGGEVYTEEDWMASYE